MNFVQELDIIINIKFQIQQLKLHTVAQDEAGILLCNPLADMDSSFRNRYQYYYRSVDSSVYLLHETKFLNISE